MSCFPGLLTPSPHDEKEGFRSANVGTNLILDQVRKAALIAGVYPAEGDAGLKNPAKRLRSPAFIELSNSAGSTTF